MVIHADEADYWDNEGHVIHYKIAADGKSAVFVSPEDAAGPRYRLTYVLTAANTVSIKFEIAPPGKPFQTYLEGKARRKL